MAEIKIQIRVTQREKDLFKYATRLCGYRSLSEFFRVAAIEKITETYPELYEAYMLERRKEWEQIK
jgi:hypothetical protein